MRRSTLLIGTLAFLGLLVGTASTARAGWFVSFGTAWRWGGRPCPRVVVHRPVRHVVVAPRHRIVHRRVRVGTPVRYRVVTPVRTVRRIVYRR